MNPFLIMFLVIFTKKALKRSFDGQRAPQGHSKGTQRTLEHSDTQGALVHSGKSALRHSKDTWALIALGHLGTWALE